MARIKKIVIATRNLGKAQRYKKMLLKVVDEVLSLDDFDFKEKPEETGETAEENAEIKAIFYAKKTNLPVFAEDESLFVDFLPEDKQPRVFIRRVNGKEVSDDELLAYWDSIIAKAPKEKRTGRWHMAYCFATPDGKTSLIALDHRRAFFSPPSKIRIPGWPMSSINGPAEFGKPHSELSEEELGVIHQGADKVLIKKIKEFLS